MLTELERLGFEIAKKLSFDKSPLASYVVHVKNFGTSFA
jgi:hypothetical protein